MQSLKDAEEAVRLLHVESNAIVADMIDEFPVAHLGADVDAGKFALCREFERIREQLDERLLEQQQIRTAGRKIADRDLPASLGTFGIERMQAGNARDALRDHLVDARRSTQKLLLTAESEAPSALGVVVGGPVAVPSVRRVSVAEVD